MSIDGVTGTARLLSPPSPFGVAVTPAGEHLYDIQFDVQGLPAPSTLGPYRTYVAWATTPQMHPVVKLGVDRATGARRSGASPSIEP